MCDSNLKNQIVQYALKIMRMRKMYDHLAEDEWHMKGEQQCVRDALHNMVVCSLIKDYHLAAYTITTNDGFTVGVDGSMKCDCATKCKHCGCLDSRQGKEK